MHLLSGCERYIDCYSTKHLEKIAGFGNRTHITVYPMVLTTLALTAAPVIGRRRRRDPAWMQGSEFGITKST